MKYDRIWFGTEQFDSEQFGSGFFCVKGTYMERKYSKEPDCLGNMVIIVSNQMKHYLHRAAESEGISGSQSRILHFLANESGERDIYQKDVEDFFCLRRSTVTQNLQGMEKKGLITRTSVSKDARLKKLVLTEQGAELEKRIHDKVLYMERCLSEGLTGEERRDFRSVLLKMSAAMAENGMAQLEETEQFQKFCRQRTGKESIDVKDTAKTGKGI